MVGVMSDIPPLVHFNYDEMWYEGCQCSLCTGYHQARDAYEAVKAQRGRHNKHCKCTACVSVKTKFLEYLAAHNRHELYSEVSYVLTSVPKPHALTEDCLAWLYGKIRDTKFRDTFWWAMSGDRYTMKKWLDTFQSEYGEQHGLPTSVWAVSGLCR